MKQTIKLSIFIMAGLAFTFPVFANEAVNSIKGETPGYSQQNSMVGMEQGKKETAQVMADNTLLNSRDRDQKSVTPIDQGNSRADTDATAWMRQTIMARDGMSVNGQNVKIITQNGKVTLRGPVKTAAEKSFIADTARGRFGVGNVDDQLEIVENIPSNY